MAGTRTTNTMIEGLHGLLGQIAQLMAAPDADLDVLSDLQVKILDIIKGPQRAALEQFAAAGGVVPGAAQAAPQAGPVDVSQLIPGAASGSAQPVQVETPYKPWGVHGGPPLPPVDELRRLISGANLA